MIKYINKVLSICLSVVIFISFAVTVFAEANETQYYPKHPYYISCNGKYISCIKNDYYSANYEKLLDRAYDGYLESVKFYSSPWNFDKTPDAFRLMMLEEIYGSQEIKKIAVKPYKFVSESDEIRYVSIFLNYSEDFSAEKNNMLLNDMDGISDILYVSDKSPCAIVGICGKDIDVVIENENVQYINYAFHSLLPYTFLNFSSNEIKFKPSVSDARAILRYAAHLEKTIVLKDIDSFEAYILCDTDLDDRITINDARTAMRIAAGLEKGNEYTFIY